MDSHIHNAASTNGPGSGLNLSGAQIDDIIKGGIPISGLFDLGPFRYSWLQPKILLSHEEIVQQSPLLQIPDSAPPLWITLGEDEHDEFHRQAAAYLHAWQASGHSGSVQAMPGLNHFTVVADLASPDSQLTTGVRDFIARL